MFKPILFLLLLTPSLLASESPSRIISLAPSVTETLFAVGLGDRLVGTTRFCNYPPAAREIRRIGSYHNPSYEAILTAKPDLVVLLTEHHLEKEKIAQLGISILQCDHRSLDAILQSITKVGEACGVSEKAREVRADLEKRRDRVANKTKNLPQPEVLVSIGRKMGSGGLKDIYIAGKKSFYQNLIQLAGGQNVFKRDAAYHNISAEGILVLNPDVVIDMVSDLAATGYKEDHLIAEWAQLPRLKAVRDGRIAILGQDYVTIPGPRVIDLLEHIAAIIHPEAFMEPTP